MKMCVSIELFRLLKWRRESERGKKQKNRKKDEECFSRIIERGRQKKKARR